MGIGEWFGRGRVRNLEKELAQLKKAVEDQGRRLTIAEGHLNDVLAGLRSAAGMAKGLKRKTEKELIEIKAAISAQMTTLERLVQGELDAARREEVKSLMAWAKSTLAKVSSHQEKLAAANDNATSTSRSSRSA